MRRRGILRATIGAACAALAGPIPALAQGPDGGASHRAARAWLALVDAGMVEESWRSAGEPFRQAISLRDWGQGLELTRRATGKTLERQLIGIDFTRNLPPWPEGDYAVVRLRAIYTGRPAGDETVVLTREGESGWRVIGFVLR